MTRLKTESTEIVNGVVSLLFPTSYRLKEVEDNNLTIFNSPH